MLKKKGFLKAFLALVFCFSLFGGNILLNTKNLYNAEAATDVSGLQETSTGGNWSFSNDTLNLSGVELSGQIILENDLNIVLQEGTTNTIFCDESAIFVSDSGQKKLTISGKGTLTLETEAPLLVFCNDEGANAFSSISFNGFSCQCKNNSGNLVDVEGNSFSGNYYKFTSTSSLGGVYSESDTSTGEPSTDEPTEGGTTSSEHTHNFNYASNGATLTAICTAEGCDLTSNRVSVSLSVADVDYGTTPSLTLDFTAFNAATGLSLSLKEDYFTSTFYKTSSENLTSGGEIISGFDAGFYYVKLSSSIDSPIGVQNLYCAFKINKISAGTFSGADAKFSLTQGETYDVSKMFTLPDGMIGSYEIVDEGTTGNGTLVGSTLSFNDAGIYKIKCTTSGSENYLSEDLIKTLTITKPLNFTVTLSDWDVGDERNSPTISLTEKTATFAYFTNEDCTTKTTNTNGASEEGGRPTGAGVYYVKATIDEDGIYEESSARARFVIWTTPTISLKSSTNTVRFNNLPYTEENVYKNVDDLFNLDANCGMATYYLVNGSTEEIISDAKLIITEVKTYLIRVKTAAENCYKASQCDCELTIQKAVFNLGASATVPDVEYGKTVQVVINERTFGAIETREFYTDAACDNDHKLSTNPTEPGTYYVVINLAETNVSESASTTKSFTITKKKITNIIWSTLEYVYNGNEQSVNVFYKDINNTNIPLDVTYKDATEDTIVPFKNVGTYKIVVDFATENEKAYYEFDEDVETFKNYRIGKVVLIYQIKNNENYYGELTSSENLSFRADLDEGDPIRGEAVPYTLKLEDDTLTINETLSMGKYKIVGTCDDPNYDITFLPGYLVIKNKILSIEFPDWTYDPDNTEPRVPVVTAIAGAEDKKFYYTPYEEEAWVETQPTKPGAYKLKVEVNATATEDYLQASKTEDFIISKIEVKKPAENNTVFIYNGKEQTYTLEESVYYTVNNSRKTSAGNYIVTVKLKNPEYYKWEDDTSSSEATRDYDFVINKRAVEKPLKNEKVFKYNGKYQNYFNFTSEESEIYRLVKEDDNSQKDVGTYTLYIELVDKVNTVWSDGTTKEIAYEFVINQANISQAVAKNDSGEELENSPVTIVETGESGFDPETELHVSVLTSSDTSKMEAYRYLLRTDLPSSFSKYDKVFSVYSISLMNGEDKITSEEKFILKLDIPTKLKDGVFDLYKVYKDENGETKTEKIQYLTYNGSVYLEADGTSEYVFVYEQNSLKALVIIFSVASGLLLLTLALQIYFLFIKKNKKSKKKNAKNIGLAALVAPTFYVHSEVVASIVLGVVMGVLILANVALFILLVLRYNKQKKLNLQAITDEAQKPSKRKTKKVIKKGNLVLSETKENSVENDVTSTK